jgi:TolB-like protein/cytochrome c-type biogenesis protein CcmH/NrfG
MQQDETLTFGRFELRRWRRELLADGKPVELGSRAFDILLALIDAGGAVVAKSELMDLVWPGTAVEENNLAVQVHALRRALGEDRRLVLTVAGRGYRFAGELRAGRGAPAEMSAVPLSIVVLPFTSLSDDREQQYFADGITLDLTTDLSRLAEMMVISRQSAFVYRDKPTDMRQIGRELGVRYVLDGSVRRLGNQVRVSVQLIEAATDAHLWAEQFDGNTADLFALQNEVTSRIAVALDVELVQAEVARSTVQPNALDHILRGRSLVLGQIPTRETYAAQVTHFERALTLAPDSARAQGLLATTLAARVLDRMTESAEADIARAEALADRALAGSPRAALPHYAKGQVLRVHRRYGDAIPEFETVLALDRNLVFATAVLGFCKLMTGSIEDAISAQQRAIRLSPRDPGIWLFYFWTGLAHLLQSRVDEAQSWFEKARIANPSQPLPHAYLAASCALNSDIQRAQAELRQARNLSGDDRFGSIARMKGARFYGVPRIYELFEATYFTGLRKAGLRD